MANITIKSARYGDRYLQLECIQIPNDSVTNTSTIKWKLSAIGNGVYPTGPVSATIDKYVVYTRGLVYADFPAEQGFTEGQCEIKHNNDGTKKIYVSIQMSINKETPSVYRKEWELETINRYATFTTHQISSKTETSVTVKWGCDVACDELYYSINGGDWVAPTNASFPYYTINDLSANTKYTIKTRVRRKDTQLTTESTPLTVTTYDYPHCIDTPDFYLGDTVTLKFYNPLSRTFKFYIIGNGTQIDSEWTCSTTEYKGVDDPTTSVALLYNTIPNSTSGQYKVKVVYDNSIKTRDNGNTYTIKENVCYPTFTTFTYKDANTMVTAVTGNNQIIVKDVSNLVVEISSANKMIAVNGANPKNYVANIDIINKDIAYSPNAVIGELGAISSAGIKRLTVTAYDTRNLPKSVYQDITIYDYDKPKINVSAKRHNNFETLTTLKVSGSYSKLTIDGVDKNTIKKAEYRYRTVDGEWSNWATLKVTITNGEFTCTDVSINLNNTQKFVIEVKVTDNLTDNTSVATIDIGQSVFFISSNQKACFINGQKIIMYDVVEEWGAW